jgi:pimeloyl-ACP methyl ester carboxylesterase
MLSALTAGLVRGSGGFITPDKPRSELEARYLASPADYVHVAGMRMHVRDSGPRDAPAVLFLHGFGASLHTWEPWAQALAADYRVVRFDLPGAGLTGADPSGDYSDARSVQVVAALMDKLGIERASLIGNSVGGRIAWKFAAQHRTRVDKLVLISPDGFATPVFRYGKPARFSLFFRLLRYALPKRILRMTLAAAYGNPATITEEEVARYYDLLLAPGVRRASLARLAQTKIEDPVPELGRIEAPTLLLWGARDAIIPYANAARYTKALRRCSHVAFPGLGHVPHEEAPALSLPPVIAFLRRRTPGAS